MRPETEKTCGKLAHVLRLAVEHLATVGYPRQNWGQVLRWNRIRSEAPALASARSWYYVTERMPEAGQKVRFWLRRRDGVVTLSGTVEDDGEDLWFAAPPGVSLMAVGSHSNPNVASVYAWEPEPEAPTLPGAATQAQALPALQVADLPGAVVLDHTGVTALVVQKVLDGPLKGKLGYVDCRGEWPEIGIDSEQDPVGKHLILLHELIHLTAQSLKGEGVVRRQPDEAFVTHAAGRLFAFLSLSGMWNGVTPEQAAEFLKARLAEAPPLPEVDRG